MFTFDVNTVHVTFDKDLQTQVDPFLRCYILTHSDRTGELFLTVAPAYDLSQISGWYTKLMRDEVVGDWQPGDTPSLHLHCHVSGGLVLGPARWRDAIFKQHLPLVVDAICHGDRIFLHGNRDLHHSQILIHCHAKQTALDRVEPWGMIADHLPRN